MTDPTRRVLLGAVGLAVPAILRLTPARADVPAGSVLRVGDQKGGRQSMMKAAGVLDGLPYQIDWTQFVAAAPLLEALNADAVDSAFAGDAPSTFALAAGLRGRIISATRGTGAGTAIMVPGESPIHTAADLKGRSIATNRGSIGHALVLAVAEAQGWGASDYKLVNLMPAEAKSALRVGAIDAWCSWGTYVAQARLVDGARVVVDGGNGLLSGLSYQVATDAAIGAKHGALLDFCRRLTAAGRWALTHADAYANVLAGEIGVSPAVAKLTFETDRPAPVPIDDKVVIDEQRTADRYFAAKVIPARLDASRVVDRSFNRALVG